MAVKRVKEYNTLPYAYLNNPLIRGCVLPYRFGVLSLEARTVIILVTDNYIQNHQTFVTFLLRILRHDTQLVRGNGLTVQWLRC